MGRSYTAEERWELAQERGIKVDAQDEWLLWSYTWSINGGGYVSTPMPRVNGKQQAALLHHCIVGRPIDGREVDHWDRSKLNNRRSNLRYITHGGNRMNSDRSDTAYHIYPVTGSYTYQVIIVREQIRHYLGVFETLEEAEGARDQWLSSEQETCEQTLQSWGLRRE